MHKAYVDGACRPNPGRGAYTYLLFDERGEIRRECGLVGERCTNNMAEYAAVIRALEGALSLQIRRLTVCMDSELVVRQLQGSYAEEPGKGQGQLSSEKKVLVTTCPGRGGPGTLAGHLPVGTKEVFSESEEVKQ